MPEDPNFMWLVGAAITILTLISQWKNIVSAFKRDAKEQTKVDATQDHEIEKLDKKMEAEINLLRVQLDSNKDAIEEIKKSIEDRDNKTLSELKELRSEMKSMGDKFTELLLQIKTR